MIGTPFDRRSGSHLVLDTSPIEKRSASVALLITADLKSSLIKLAKRTPESLVKSHCLVATALSVIGSP
jgi:hypothetical protein